MARWLIDYESPDWTRHKCSVCGKRPISEIIVREDYEEDANGYWCHTGQRETGVHEYLTPHCPWCGSATKEVEQDGCSNGVITEPPECFDSWVN